MTPDCRVTRSAPVSSSNGRRFVQQQYLRQWFETVVAEVSGVGPVRESAVRNVYIGWDMTTGCVMMSSGCSEEGLEEKTSGTRADGDMEYNGGKYEGTL